MLFLSASVGLSAQKRACWEVMKEMPAFVDSIHAGLTYPDAWGNSDITDFSRWRAHAREVLGRCMLAAPPRAVSYDCELVECEKRDGYEARMLRMNLTGFSRVNLLMLVPDGPGPHPGVLLMHDHGGHYFIGKEKMIRPLASAESMVRADADRWVSSLYEGQYMGDYLASRGYVVVCADALMWGERGRREGVNKNKLGAFAGNMLSLGYCLSGYTTWEDIYLTEFMTTLPEVDPERIGTAGFSMGAYRAWMLAAMTDMIKATSAICWMTTTRSQFSWEHGRENGGFTNTLPGLRRHLDHPHVASMACPGAMQLLSGNHDKLFARDGIEDAFGIMRRVWDGQGCSGRLDARLLDMGHECGRDVQKLAGDFFDRNL